MSQKQILLESIFYEEPHPCDNCIYSRTCEIDHKACEQFDKYIKTGDIDTTISKHPTFSSYDSIFSRGHKHNGFDYVDGNELYEIYKQRWFDTKHSFIMHKISMLYESSVSANIDPIIAEISTDWNWWFCIAKCPSVVVGAVAWRPLNNQMRDLSFLYIRNAYKKQGIGSRLVSMIEDGARAVITSPENKSQRFYEKLGYEEIPETKKLLYRKETRREG